MPSYGAQPLTDKRPRDRFPMEAMDLSAPSTVEVNLGLTRVVRRYYTQKDALCVSYSLHQALTFFNGRLYDPSYAFYLAGGDPARGSNTAKVCDVLRTKGTVIVSPPYPSRASETNNPSSVPVLGEGIKENRWLSGSGDKALQEIRTSLSLRVPVMLILPMFGATLVGDRYFWNVPSSRATPGGWHQICLTYSSDAESVLASPNSWGDGPLYALHYEDLALMVNMHGAYGTVITDSITGTEGPMPPDDPPPEPPAPTPSPQPKPPKERRRRRRRRRIRVT